MHLRPREQRMAFTMQPGCCSMGECPGCLLRQDSYNGMTVDSQERQRRVYTTSMALMFLLRWSIAGAAGIGGRTLKRD